MNPEIIPLVLAGVVCAVIVFVAWDSGLFAWARRGCPDYNEPPERWLCASCSGVFEGDDAFRAHLDAEHRPQGWPAGRDLQSGWPRDTGTKP